MGGVLTVKSSDPYNVLFVDLYNYHLYLLFTERFDRCPVLWD